MTNVKLAVIYYSSTGTNYKLAQIAAETAKQEGAEVRLLKVQELASEAVIASNPTWKAHVEATREVPVAAPNDIVWTDAVIFCTPTRFGNVASQMKQFLDTTGGIWFEGKTANKVVSAMSSANNPNGGQEETILSLYTTMYHWGAIVVAPGYTDPSIFEAGGNPYGTTVTVDNDGNWKEDAEKAVRHQTKRVLTVASWIKKGQNQS